MSFEQRAGQWAPVTWPTCRDEAGWLDRPCPLSRKWREAVVVAGLPPIKLHGGRHTAATLVTLDNVPISVVAVWIGHSDAVLTMRDRGGQRSEVAWCSVRTLAATLMHLDGVPTGVIAVWIGHSDPGLALRVYAHSQDDALRAAGLALDAPGRSSG